MFRPLAALLLALAALPASAQMYKCTVNGKPSYQETPCATGPVQKLKLDAAPEPDPNADEQRERQRDLAERLSGERAERDAAERQERAYARQAATERKHRCDRSRLERRWAEEDAHRPQRNAAERAQTAERREAEWASLGC
ncbi:MAG: DUF4124 domain-containing protein [Pseudomonadota bacterium]